MAQSTGRRRSRRVGSCSLCSDDLRPAGCRRLRRRLLTRRTLGALLPLRGPEARGDGGERRCTPRHGFCVGHDRLCPRLAAVAGRPCRHMARDLSRRQAEMILPPIPDSVPSPLGPVPVVFVKNLHTKGPERADALGYFEDRKSTRLNSSHVEISYAVFCLKKKKKKKKKK